MPGDTDASRLLRASLLLLLALGARAQTTLYTIRGDARSGFGEAIAGPGDVDGDGRADLLVADTEDQVGDAVGTVSIYSGYSGTLLRSIRGREKGDRFGAFLCGAGDVDRDGCADFLVGIGAYLKQAGYVQLISGKTCTVLWTCDGNAGETRVASLPDIDRDGTPDCLVGCRTGLDARRRETGYARVLSGRDGHELARVFGDAALDGFGTSLAGVGDVDGDGVCDFAVGAPVPREHGRASAGYVRVFSGKSFAPLRTLVCGQPKVGFGGSLCAVGDVDGDGCPDLAIGATPRLLSSGAGAVDVISLRDGLWLQTIEGPALDPWFGSQIDAIGDIDGDGRPEIVIAGYECVLVHSLRAKEPLLELRPAVRDARDRYFRVAAGGDMNRDGEPELLIASRAQESGKFAWIGHVQAISTRTLPLCSETHELRCEQGGTQTLTMHAGPRWRGASYAFVGTLSGTTPGVQVGPVILPANLDRYLVGTLTPAQLPIFEGFQGKLDAQGNATARLRLPGLGSQLKGVTAHHVCVVWSADVLPFASNPVPLTFVP